MTTEPLFPRIALIGLGLIGSSLARVARREGSWMHVAEVDGFVGPDDEALKALEARDVVQRVSVIGAYATTLDRDIGGSRRAQIRFGATGGVSP